MPDFLLLNCLVFWVRVKFNLRISPALHEKLAIAAQASGKSINALAQQTLAETFV